MSVGLITRSTSRVEHLGVWAYDRISEDSRWNTGRYVPMCGQEKDHGRWSVVEWPTGRLEQVRRKRLCSRCQQLLQHLIDLTLVHCRVCRCTDENGCWPGCHWIELDPVTRTGLCSSCVDLKEQP